MNFEAQLCCAFHAIDALNNTHTHQDALSRLCCFTIPKFQALEIQMCFHECE